MIVVVGSLSRTVRFFLVCRVSALHGDKPNRDVAFFSSFRFHPNRAAHSTGYRRQAWSGPDARRSGCPIRLRFPHVGLRFAPSADCQDGSQRRQGGMLMRAAKTVRIPCDCGHWLAMSWGVVVLAVFWLIANAVCLCLCTGNG
jgi:hypothetical protein